MRLSALQSGFLGWLASGEESEATALPIRREQGLAVYQNNYRASLMACLADTYPQTLAWLGEAEFCAAAARHIDRVVPHSWTLDDYADDFPASLAADHSHEPEVGELAQIELALSQAFIAADAVVLSPDLMASVDWDKARLKVIPALSILSQHSNAADIWMALTDGEAPPAASKRREASAILVWRREGLCRLRRLEADEAAMLEMLANGRPSFEDLCQQAIARWGEEQGIMTIGQWLSRWVCDGLILAAEAEDCSAGGATSA